MHSILDNLFWHSLCGPHAGYAAGTSTARRYAPGFSPLLGFADNERPDFAALGPFCTPGERLYCNGWRGAAPGDWQIDSEVPMFRMVWAAPAPTPDDGFDAVALGPRHAALALELATLTQPGPFGPRTIELGDYVGCFEGPRLIAMAGERLHAGRMREISGVCTHPEFQGRGLARRLVAELVRRELGRDQTPFLHVLRANVAAHGLYERMGFRVQAEPVVRVVHRLG